MRLATYNIEWFDTLFEDDGAPRLTKAWSARYNITCQMQLEAIAQVLHRIDADAVMVIEAPDSSRKRSTARALTAFAQWAGLRLTEAMTGFANDTQQEIALWYDPEIITAAHDPHSSAEAPRFDASLRIDLDVDANPDTVTFSKPPLELAITPKDGTPFHWIGVHLKSKAPHGAEGRDAIMRAHIANRRKQLAQAIWVRRRVAAHLAQGTRLVVAGDFNDGPGLDAYEALFGKSSVEILLGQGVDALFDPHAAQALQRRLGAQPTTARFYLRHEKRYLQALLDYIMVCPGLRAVQPSWRIWHPFDDPECWSDIPLREALLTASDHFPVTLDLPTG